MTRYIVAYEERELVDGSIISAGALVPRSQQLPVTYAFNQIEVLGWASEFQRVNDALSFEIAFKESWYESRFKELGLLPTISLRGRHIWSANPGVQVARMSRGEIYEITFTVAPMLYKEK